MTQELGGKSANIISDDTDLVNAPKEGVQVYFRNSGRSCNAPTLLPRSKMTTARGLSIAEQVFESTVVSGVGL